MLNFLRGAVDKTGVDQVSRPMQIALVAVVLLAGMWFTVLKPKPDSGSSSFTPVAAAPATPAAASSEPVAPGVKGLTSAVDKAKAAATVSDAANAKVQQATGSSPAAATPAAAAKPAAATAKAKAATTAAAKAKVAAAATAAAAAKAKATATAAAKVKSTAVAKAKAAKPAVAPVKKTAVDVDPSDRLLAYLAKGKTLVILFHGAGADDRAARKAVHRTALADPKHVVSAYIPIGDVGKYEAITSDVQVLAAPTILIIGTNGKATLLTGYVDTAVVRQTVGDARRQSAADAKAKTTK